MKIGVFDSGKGGASIAGTLDLLIPGAKIISIDDHANVPYGGRPEEEIISLTDTALQSLLNEGCDVIVIACNTATTVAISTLRERYPEQHFVGIEPMIKPAAAHTKTGRIAVLATPATLRSARYNELKNEWAREVTVLEPDCSSWAEAIEYQREAELPVETVIADLVEKGVDEIVLACTHYHWLVDRIEAAAGPDVEVLEPSDAIKNRIVELLTLSQPKEDEA
jgi:glutamate racemase